MIKKNWFYKTPVDLYSERKFLLNERDGGNVYYTYTGLLAEAAKHAGKLMMSEGVPHTAKSLSSLIGLGNAKGMERIIAILKTHKLLKVIEGNIFFMTEIPALTLSKHDFKSVKDKV